MQKLSKTFATLALLGLAASGAHADVVISQLYGGGGSSSNNPTPSFKYDYVELYNSGSTAVDLTSYSLQYASSTGNFPTSGNNLFVFSSTNGSTTIAANSYFLVRFGTASTFTGADIPNYDASGLASLSATVGKVALVNNATGLPNKSATQTGVVDYIGYGTAADTYEGTGPAPAPSTTTADFRTFTNGAFVDTNNNAVDFTTSTPVPHYSGGLAAAPEPSSVAAMVIGAGVLGLIAVRRRKTVAA